MALGISPGAFLCLKEVSWMASRTRVGREGEEAAARFLEGRGYRIVARNVRFRHGEIDIVAEDEGALVFVEVKTRRSDRFGTAAEAVNGAKQRQLVALASLYLAGLRSGTDRACRFDVVSVNSGPAGWECAVIKNAFGAN